MSDPGAEPVEIVDRHGSVVDVVTRAEMRGRNLRHRCTYVVVTTAELEPGPPISSEPAPRLQLDDPIVVHRRADWKDTYPSYWDIAFGGVCGVGEPWDSSARRELAEEAGITDTELVPVGGGRYEDDTNRVVGRIYLARWAGPMRFDDGEVVATDGVVLGELADWVDRHRVCPDSATMIVPELLKLVDTAF